MVLLLSLCLTMPLLWWGGAWLRRHDRLSYGICIILAVSSLLLWLGGSDDFGFWPGLAASLLTKGGLAGCLFLFVMFAGAVPEGTVFRKRILPLRGQVSVMASILALGHAAVCGATRFPALFLAPGELRLWTLLASVLSLLLLLILLPLFITSLRVVRRRMSGRTWKRLQRSAYAFYALVYLHILFFRMQALREGQWDAVLSVCLYSTIFTVYLTLRLTRTAKPDLMLPVQFLCVALPICLLALSLYPAGNTGPAAAADVPAETVWADGEYKGAAIGYNGRLKVSVRVENGRLAEVQLKSHVEDEPYVTRATEGVFPAMIAGNTAEVDAVSTATTTSQALMEAVRQALDSAVIPP